jgi:formylglycine-generating enzyme required for sulfatase activity
MSHAQRAATALVLAIAAASCELIVGIPEVTVAPAPDGGSDAPAQPDAQAADGGEASTSSDADAAATGIGCGRVASDGRVRAGPDMVRVDGPFRAFCIDTTEVTVAQFNAFILDAGGFFVGTPPGACDAAGPVPPAADQTPANQDLPVGTLGACHAWSYCQWAGKRLCGTLGDGGPIGFGAAATDLEWVYACVNGANNYAYPYGEQYDAQACNADHADGGRVPVKSMTGCHGVAPPYDQIYDMVGNVWEFVADLTANDGNVSAKGGAWTTTGDAMASAGGGCLVVTSFQGASTFNFDRSGFRCCADP